MELIKVVELKKSYLIGNATLEVLKGVSFSLNEGEFVMIVGPSGCGKSTLLHLIGGLDRATQGEIYLKKKCSSELSDRASSRLRRQTLGFIFQSYHLLPELTAYENVFLPSRLGNGERSWKEKRERARFLIDTVGLGERRNHRPQELSGGEEQRLAIARALMNSPQLILADEPTGNLDTQNGEKILELLEVLRKTHGLSILMVTHNPDFLKRADRVLRMKDGQIQ